ncbi:MAG: Zn-finger nucleic acid-binding protein [Cycloclasticus pugetii]
MINVFDLVILEQISENAIGATNMPYVNRNEHGEVTELLDVCDKANGEWLDVGHADVIEFLRKPSQANKLKESLSRSDSEMVRVVEDLVDMLMEKQVFVFTELPEAVQDKLNKRKKLRHDVNALSNLIGDDDNIL